jgi:hypothetical protein
VWGDNSYGQCSVPSPNTGFTAVAGGLYHVLGLRGAPAGACCHPDGTCALVIQAGCPAPGAWQGPSADCVVNPCPQPLGACCAPAGACRMKVQVECATPSSWQGPGVSCDPNPCTPVTGACCTPLGICTTATQAACPAPNTWMGADILCNPNPCTPSTGACCSPAGTCAVTLQTDCLSPNAWQGGGISCSPDPCPAGACCLGLYCLVSSGPDCTRFLGLFEGIATLCAPNPCGTSAVADPSLSGSSSRVWAVPNPGRGQTLLHYRLPLSVAATLQIFDAAGSLVRRFPLSPRSDGQGAVRWNGRDEAGRVVPSGVYLVRLTTPTGETSGRVVLTQ